METIKEKAMLDFDNLCKAIFSKHGTLKTYGMNYDLSIQKHVEMLNHVGATRKEVEEILDKYKKQ